MAEAMEISTLPKSPEPHRIKLETVTVVVDMLFFTLFPLLFPLPFLRPWWIFPSPGRLLGHIGRFVILEVPGEVLELVHEQRSAGLVAQRQQGIRYFSREHEIFFDAITHGLS